MDLNISWEGRQVGVVHNDKIVFTDKKADIGPYLDNIFGGLQQEEDEYGNVILNTMAPSLTQKLAKLREIGFEITEK